MTMPSVSGQMRTMRRCIALTPHSGPRGISDGVTQLGIAGSDAAAAVGDVGNGVSKGLAIAGAGAIEAVGAGATAAGRRSVAHSSR